MNLFRGILSASEVETLIRLMYDVIDASNELYRDFGLDAQGHLCDDLIDIWNDLMELRLRRNYCA